MALSSWDTLAVDLDGNPTTGAFVSPGGVKVEIYKNWVYIDDTAVNKKAESDFMHPCVMEIQEGDIHYRDVHVKAIRGPQNGVFVAAWSTVYGGPEARPSHKYTGMVGCGVSGYAGNRWVGVTKKSFQFLQKWIAKKEPGWTAADAADTAKQVCKHWKSEGKSRKQIAARRKRIKVIWMEPSLVFPKEIATVKLGKAVRFNQGNLFFAKNAGMPLQASKPRKAGTPMLAKMIKNTKASKGKKP